jgi:FixJ family two-component response regulator
LDIAVAAVKAGAHDFIEKPFDADTVVDRVREAVQAHRARGTSSERVLKERRFAGAETWTTR